MAKLDTEKYRLFIYAGFPEETDVLLEETDVLSEEKGVLLRENEVYKEEKSDSF